jgi:hypothetical protein
VSFKCGGSLAFVEVDGESVFFNESEGIADEESGGEEELPPLEAEE